VVAALELITFNGEACILTHLLDITERKLAEEALRAARDELELRVEERTKELAVANEGLLNEIAEREEIERQLRIQTTAMEAAADGILITDRQGNIQWTNPALAQISGYNREDLIGHSTRVFNSGQHDADYYRQMWGTILSGEVWRGEMTNRRKDGSLYVEEQTITPVRGNESEITQFIAIKQDITERKQAEKEIRERNQKEKILTQTIHTMQLDIARDLHDTIGQNISFLRMKLDYLAEKKTRKKTEMQLELRSMARAANESYDLMRGTLAVLQSESSTDLFRLFTRYAEQIKERSSFEIDFSSQGEPRFMSAKRMRQLFYIFREILNNIEKHANASQVSMAMTWAREALNLVIFDNGSGFDMDKIQYGSHYGLKFMRERAELLNGSMIIRSEVGSGTKIILEIPYE
jgi:PAS domain S-box-containing protein